MPIQVPAPNYQFGKTFKCLSAQELADALRIPIEHFREAIELLADNRHVLDSLMHYVNTFACCRRHLNNDGQTVEDPQSLRVKVVRDFAALNLHAGQILELPYGQALALINDRIVALPE